MGDVTFGMGDFFFAGELDLDFFVGLEDED